MRILLIEDERRVADFVQRGLGEEGHVVDLARNAAEALSGARNGRHDAIIMDIGLPDGSGYDVTRALRAEGVAVPILMLTAHDAPEEVVAGLDAGGDDYLTKPFDFAELLARLRALARRSAAARTTAGRDTVLRADDLVLDRVSHEVTRAGRPIRLTPIEYRLLETLMAADGAPVRRETLLQQVWGMSFDPGTGLIDVHVANLRQKLEHAGGRRVVLAVKGVGFRFDGGE